MVDYEKEAEELMEEVSKATHNEIKIVAERLKKMYNYGKGWKRDRMFVSQEEHEQKYERKTPGKTYKTQKEEED